ncbi:MAG: peptide-methionine (S)-S-oxide reductase MsrA [Candidatus Sungbacteria bacterium]|uniref:Peptide methionine sulfoxide reductase MsrA n=1 Tax=Candidatus Sungiibacteriota bacterium TaxID=2750080 RepID=A0A933DRX4_9BACT|nr:peptide-methionine (S)-S-oxide reductase MsrA [Candidatus Sungbacteria bacterium]
MTSPSDKIEIIVFGGGCFWCTEAVFLQLKGVRSVTSGYAGGIVPDPTYEQVSTGKTGHAEVIKIEYDSAIIPLRKLLEVFFVSHDATTLNRQGADVGSQYRSIILYTTAAQRQAAETMISELTKARKYSNPIVTEIAPLETFYPAEEYHRDFYAKNPGEIYSQSVIAPKIEKVQENFSELLKTAEDR